MPGKPLNFGCLHTDTVRDRNPFGGAATGDLKCQKCGVEMPPSWFDEVRERQETEMYEAVKEYSASKGVQLEQGWRVWVLAPQGVQPSGRADQDVFATMTEALDFAHQHPAQNPVLVTGPAHRYKLAVKEGGL